MPTLTATSALVGAAVLLGAWSGRRWGRWCKRAFGPGVHRFRARGDR